MNIEKEPGNSELLLRITSNDICDLAYHIVDFFDNKIKTVKEQLDAEPDEPDDAEFDERDSLFDELGDERDSLFDEPPAELDEHDKPDDELDELGDERDSLFDEPPAELDEPDELGDELDELEDERDSLFDEPPDEHDKLEDESDSLFDKPPDEHDKPDDELDDKHLYAEIINFIKKDKEEMLTENKCMPNFETFVPINESFCEELYKIAIYDYYETGSMRSVNKDNIFDRTTVSNDSFSTTRGTSFFPYLYFDSKYFGGQLKIKIAQTIEELLNSNCIDPTIYEKLRSKNKFIRFTVELYHNRKTSDHMWHMDLDCKSIMLFLSYKNDSHVITAEFDFECNSDNTTREPNVIRFMLINPYNTIYGKNLLHSSPCNAEIPKLRECAKTKRKHPIEFDGSRTFIRIVATINDIETKRVSKVDGHDSIHEWKQICSSFSRSNTNIQNADGLTIKNMDTLIDDLTKYVTDTTDQIEFTGGKRKTRQTRKKQKNRKKRKNKKTKKQKQKQNNKQKTKKPSIM